MATVALYILAVVLKGDMPMLAAIAVNLATQIILVVGSRVEGIAEVVT